MLIQKRYITNISIVFKCMLFKRFMIWGCCVEYCRRLFLFFLKISMCVRNIKLAYKMIHMLNECRAYVDLKKRPKIPQEKQIQNSKRDRYQILRPYKSWLMNYGIIHVIRMFSLFRSCIGDKLIYYGCQFLIKVLAAKFLMFPSTWKSTNYRTTCCSIIYSSLFSNLYYS